MLSQSHPYQACAHLSKPGKVLIVEHSHDLQDLVKPKDDAIKAGDKAILTQGGKGVPVQVLELIFDKNMILSYKVKFPDNTCLIVNKILSHTNINSDVGIIPATTELVEAESSRMKKETVNKFLQPQILTSVEEDFIHWCHHLMHLSPEFMMQLLDMGILPSHFSKMKRIPKCASCAFGQAHRRSWQHKGQKGRSIVKVTEVAPDNGVSVDQIMSAQPGLIPQMTRKLTSGRINGATVFVDHISYYTYMHLMQELTSDATIEAKAACKKVFGDFGHKIKIMHYHTDNRRFAEEKFVNNIKLCNQKILFCGVGAHHQNTNAEKAIKELTVIARTILLHAPRHWPEYISTISWPLALKSASERMNILSVNSKHQSPASTISATNNIINHKDFHTRRCPVHLLQGGLQSGSIVLKLLTITFNQLFDTNF